MFVPENVRYVIILMLVYSHVFISASIHGLIEENAVLYSNCRIISSTQLDCSNLKLKELPNNMPNTILSLNFSNNQLKIDQATFASCHNLSILDLSNNEISIINQDSFKHLVNITIFILRNNSISEFDSETFSNLVKLEHLDLSGNPLVLQKDFINNTNLRELNMDDCNLTDIPNEAFSGIKQLKVLTLKKNPLNDDFEISAFDDLISLTSLEIKNISRDLIMELCNKLTAIDTINLEGYNFSCFIYTTSENFEEAIVGNDPPIEQPLTIPRTTSPTTISIITSTLPTTLSSVLNSTISIITNEQINHLETTTPAVDHATVDIDNKTIKYILVGILVVTLTGILIGLVCRADVFGIKTKLCRSKKSNNNRRAPEDTVSPFEEIPLNTINSNGKSVEG